VAVPGDVTFRVIIGIVGAALGAVPGIFSVLWGSECLIFGSDRLQLVRGRKVLGQIPYDNVVEARPGWVDTDRGQVLARVEIALLKRKRPDIWWVRFAKSREYDVGLGNVYVIDPSALERKLTKCVERHREKQWKK
jgi:hypothetical protein